MTRLAQRDWQLIDRARRGDSAAFGKLVCEHQDSVYRLCTRHAGGAGAEDLAQETFLRAFVHREKLDPDQDVRSWLLSIAHRLCIDRFRTRRDFAPLDEIDAPAPEVDIDAQIDARVLLARLQAAMAALTPGQREAVSLYHLEGLAYADIARVLGVPIGTVMSWLHRARERLRQSVGEEAA